MPDENVISFGSRRPLAVEEAEKKAIEEQVLKFEAEKCHQQHAEMTDSVRKLLALVESGVVEGLVILGRRGDTGLFFTETHLEAPLVARKEMPAYAGMAQALTAELVDRAAFAPAYILHSDQVFDPWEEAEEIEELYPE